MFVRRPSLTASLVTLLAILATLILAKVWPDASTGPTEPSLSPGGIEIAVGAAWLALFWVVAYVLARLVSRTRDG